MDVLSCSALQVVHEHGQNRSLSNHLQSWHCFRCCQLMVKHSTPCTSCLPAIAFQAGTHCTNHWNCPRNSGSSIPSLDIYSPTFENALFCHHAPWVIFSCPSSLLENHRSICYGSLHWTSLLWTVVREWLLVIQTLTAAHFGPSSKCLQILISMLCWPQPWFHLFWKTISC